jgi:hypothetical protein
MLHVRMLMLLQEKVLLVLFLQLYSVQLRYMLLLLLLLRLNRCDSSSTTDLCLICQANSCSRLGLP